MSHVKSNSREQRERLLATTSVVNDVKRDLDLEALCTLR